VRRVVAPPREPACGYLDKGADASRLERDSAARGPTYSIVVLPFANLSGDPAQDYLADASTDQLTTSLARLSGTFVIARNAAMTFKGKPVDAKAIGGDLGVRYVLEGSVQPSSNRVNAQLIDADSGAHLWAEQFDAARADLLQTQDDIVTHLARALQVQLTDAEAARLKRSPPANRDAEDLALQCAAATFLRKALFGKEADAGCRLCEQALAADPNNVDALTLLANKFNVSAGFGLSADPEVDAPMNWRRTPSPSCLGASWTPARLACGASRSRRPKACRGGGLWTVFESPSRAQATHRQLWSMRNSAIVFGDRGGASRP
jgi:TolB-like protein